MGVPDGLRRLDDLTVAPAERLQGIPPLLESNARALGVAAGSLLALRKAGMALCARSALPTGVVGDRVWVSPLGDLRIPTARLLVRFEPTSTPARNRAALLSRGVEIVHEFRGGRLFSVRSSVADDADPGASDRRLRAVACLRSARRVWRRPMPGRAWPFDDVRLHEQWAWRNTGQTGGVLGADVNAFPAWKGGVTGAGVRVAVIDLAFDMEHEDLEAGIDVAASGAYVEGDQGGVTFVSPCPSVTYESHGTNVAGLLGARADNGVGGCGIAPDATLLPIMVPAYCAEDTFLRALRFAADPREEFPPLSTVRGADILTCSLGWSGPISEDVHDELRRLRTLYRAKKKRRGKLLVWAGPHGDDVITPESDGIAGSDLVLTVGTSSDDDERLPCGFGPHLDVLAPGERLLTTHPSDSDYGPYVEAGETSMAAPIAAGVAALALQANPVLGAADLERVVCETCEKIGGAAPNYDAQGHDLKYGYGRVDAGRAVETARTLFSLWKRLPWRKQLELLRKPRHARRVPHIHPPKSESKRKVKVKSKKPAGKRKKRKGA
jgi:subtilisin family serine protease